MIGALEVVTKERVEHSEGKDLLERIEDLAKRAQRVAMRGYVQASRAAEKLGPSTRQEKRSGLEKS